VSGIAFEHVSKVFADGTVAVVDLVLGIEDGEFCVLVGPSGCGKSTVLRLIAGLEQVTRGVIRLGDQVVNDVSPQERDLAMVFAGSALYPHLDVAGNLGFSLKMQGEPPAERADRVRGAAARLGIGGLLGRRPRSSPRASASARRSDARWCASRARSSWTSRCPASTRAFACRCARRSRGCIATAAPRSSTSRTTTRRRWRWAIASR
jgi:ABC-type uncharacterized transport system YnjBCD ATPase subunit